MTVDADSRHDLPDLDAARPVVAVAVSSHERPKGVRALIAALEAQTLPRDRFEVVIVDDGSSPEAFAALEHERARTDLDLKIVRFDHNQGPAVGRNTAWRSSSAPIVAFTDDDCMPTPTWLEEGVRAMRATPSVLVGATEPDPAERHLIDPLSRTMHVLEATFAPTCNVFYLRRDLEAVGGFDETFRQPVGEDTDLAWRVKEAVGRELLFAEKALVYHDVRRRTFAQAVKETSRWAGVPPVVKRHPLLAREAWHRGYFMRISHERVLLGVLGLLIGIVFPPALLLTLPWLRYRVIRGFLSKRLWTNIRFAPHVFAIDLLEVWVLLRSSIKHRTLIL